MKITKDGFIWKVITFDVAKVIISSGALEVYALWKDGSETLINVDDYDEFINFAESGVDFGIEVGKIEVEQAKEIITNSGRGLVTYSIADFEGRAKDLIKDSEEEQETLDFDETKFPFALEKMCTNHDMCNGITWETIDFYLMEYCTK